MTLYDNRASKEVPRLPKVVYAGPTNAGTATVLLQSRVQEGEQSLASGALASEAGESELLARAEGSGTSPPVAKGEPGLLAKSPARRAIALQDDIARTPAV